MRGLYGDEYFDEQAHRQPAAVAVAKAVAAAAAAGSMLVLSALTLTGTVLALVVATPLLVIFSPVLVPAAVAVALLAAGFVSSGAFGAAAMGVLAWMYRYLSALPGEGPEGARLESKAHDVKDWAQHRLDQARAQ